MHRVYACLANQHDLRLVLVAGLVSLLASWTALSLARRGAGDRRGRAARPVWLAIAAVVTGCGIWATHFVGVLAFGAGVPVGYDLWLTVLSVVVAIAVTGCGFAVAARGGTARLWLAGAVAGAGIGAMHYTGMAALRMPAHVGWDAGLVAASLLLGVGLGSAAFRVALGGPGPARMVAGTLSLAAAICATHFTGMGALHLEPSPLLPIPEHRLSPGWLAVGVAAAATVSSWPSPSPGRRRPAPRHARRARGDPASRPRRRGLRGPRRPRRGHHPRRQREPGQAARPRPRGAARPFHARCSGARVGRPRPRAPGLGRDGGLRGRAGAR